MLNYNLIGKNEIDRSFAITRSEIWALASRNTIG